MAAGQQIVLYDGDCGVCNRFVQFLLQRDVQHSLLYAPLQGQTARRILNRTPPLDTMIYFDGERTFERSEAVLRILHRLNPQRRLISLLLRIPSPIRDYFYTVFARNRHRIMPKPPACRLLSETEKKQFLP